MIRLLAAILIFVGVAGGSSAQQRFTVEFEVAGLSCVRCAATATRALAQIPGVAKANVDFSSKRGRVDAERAVGEDEIRRALAKFGFEARFPKDETIPPLTAAERARLDIKVASIGEAIDLRKHLARGKITIFDFWAEWCGPCHLLTPKLERLVQENAAIALRTIDVKQWDSPAGRQATKELNVRALPYVRVYGPDGRFAGEVLGNDIDKVKRLIAGTR